MQAKSHNPNIRPIGSIFSMLLQSVEPTLDELSRDERDRRTATSHIEHSGSERERQSTGRPCPHPCPKPGRNDLI